MGTPDIAAQCLEALYAAGHEICRRVTRRDKPVGRKRCSPLRRSSRQAGGAGPRYSGLSAPHPAGRRRGRSSVLLRRRMIVVVAYGCILPASVLQIPHMAASTCTFRCCRITGAAHPGAVTVLNGDAETGVSIMQMDEGLDTGAVLAAVKRSPSTRKRPAASCLTGWRLWVHGCCARRCRHCPGQPAGGWGQRGAQLGPHAHQRDGTVHV